MKITILGSGTSCGVPMIGCDCEVCTSANPKNKRLRSSAYVETEKAKFLIDCSADFRQQALTHQIRRIDALFITHAHSDHVGGLDDLRIYNYLQDSPIKCYGSIPVLEELRKRYDYCFNPAQIGGGVPQIELIPFEEPFELAGIKITPLPVMHGRLPIQGYRFDDFTYISDASFIPDETKEKIMGARILVINALRHRPHSTHFSLTEALEVSNEFQPEKTYFTHISHQLEHWTTNHYLPPDARLAYDGMTIDMDEIR